MKKFIFLTTFVCLLSLSVFAQNKTVPDFSGNWTLDTAKSKLEERMRIESMTLDVSQTVAELKVITIIKRAARSEGEMPNGGMGRGGGRMGGGSRIDDGTVIYDLDGKETTAPAGSGRGSGVVASKIGFEDGKLKTTLTRNFSSPMGEVTIITRETWELSDGGKTLKIVREMETPRGNTTSEMIFTKK